MVRELNLSAAHGSGVRGPRDLAYCRLAFGGELSAGLPAVFEAELANQAVEIAGQRREVLQGLHGLFRTMRAFRRKLRDLSGGFGISPDAEVCSVAAVAMR